MLKVAKGYVETGTIQSFTLVGKIVARKTLYVVVKCSGVTPIYSRSLERKKVQAFWLLPKFSLVLGLLKSRISKNSFEGFLRKLNFKLFHYKARVQPVGKITTIAIRNRC